jgi:hypothetical protein
MLAGMLVAAMGSVNELSVQQFMRLEPGSRMFECHNGLGYAGTERDAIFPSSTTKLTAFLSPIKCRSQLWELAFVANWHSAAT